jgi:hypothetical protein
MSLLLLFRSSEAEPPTTPPAGASLTRRTSIPRQARPPEFRPRPDDEAALIALLLLT